MRQWKAIMAVSKLRRETSTLNLKFAVPRWKPAVVAL